MERVPEPPFLLAEGLRRGARQAMTEVAGRVRGRARVPGRAAPALTSTKQSLLEPSPHLADRIYEQMLQQIISEKFKVGDRLPTEALLGEQYKVSRAVIREAISRLLADGVVVTRQGSGTFVSRHPGREFLSLAPIGGIADLMRCFEFRIALEGEASYIAAKRRTEEHMASIDDAFEKLEGANAARQLGVEEDINFHAAIGQATRNEIFVQTLDVLAVHIFNGMNITRSLSLTRSSKRLALVQEEHRRVIEAIRAGNGQLARKAMRTHIDNARRRALGDSTEP